MVRQLGSAALLSLFLGALAGGIVCMVAFSENLAGDIVDVNGHLDLGFLGIIFLEWSAPFAAGLFLIGAIWILITSAVRWAAERMTKA